MNWVRVASIDDVPAGEMLGLTVQSRRVAIFHLETGELRATTNVCTHEFAVLTDGWFEGCEVECPLHAGRFDVRTGKGLCPPIARDLIVYEVKLEGSNIYVALPEAEA
ncbi:non-heme iron oxygenase ferredoxin subunit (plasmid) [Mesorhizobium sp. B2-1-8]|uniref:non-heme iron oxygenase ferredoxin subunit n=1 Tax=Mesorhizobium sp. B2-1-8 TaxID=2589967 RepID=UPI001129E924|nr:non-heme iron oxygenase ferredoxin subunit [Mesorhizobium sp. B2-1-8]UCI22802.1 non-heme iron oxygenase ferredoxin subunit [Mesorhizobium sp. B2-1-8]